jgi:transcriptional antiterminator NusG
MSEDNKQELKTPYEIAEQKKQTEAQKESKEEEIDMSETKLFALRTTANREEQVVDFVTTNAQKKGLAVYSIIKPHGMRGYVFVEAESLSDAEQAAYGVPYARGVLSKEIDYSEIEHMIEQDKKEINIQKNDIAEIISGPFKREQCKITRIDKVKGDVVVELLEAAVPIPITLKLDDVKVIRREHDNEE